MRPEPPIAEQSGNQHQRRHRAPLYLIPTCPALYQSASANRSRSIFEDGLDIFDLVDLRRRIALDQHQVRLFAGLNGADVVLLAFKTAPFKVAI